MKTTVINLFCGPGGGKSTLAADIYVQMKKANKSVEMVREVAKEWAWEGREIGRFDQMAIIGEQMKRENSLYGRVDYIITDSPVALGAFYLEYNHKVNFMTKMVLDFYQDAKIYNITYKNFFLKRPRTYEANGRYENKFEAVTIDKHLKNYLKINNLKCQNKNPDMFDVLKD